MRKRQLKIQFGYCGLIGFGKKFGTLNIIIANKKIHRKNYTKEYKERNS